MPRHSTHRLRGILVVKTTPDTASSEVIFASLAWMKILSSDSENLVKFFNIFESKSGVPSYQPVNWSTWTRKSPPGRLIDSSPHTIYQVRHPEYWKWTCWRSGMKSGVKSQRSRYSLPGITRRSWNRVASRQHWINLTHEDYLFLTNAKPLGILGRHIVDLDSTAKYGRLEDRVCWF